MLQNRAQHRLKDELQLSPSNARARTFPALVRDAEFQAAIDETEIVIGDAGGQAFLVPSAGRLIIADHTLHSPLAAVYLRWGLELAWLKGRAPLDPALCELLAARFAAVCRQANGELTSSLSYLDGFVAHTPNDRDVAELWSSLASKRDLPFALADATCARARAAWGLAAPAHHIMASGMRSAHERDMARFLRPDPEVAGLSSCTASSISLRSYRAAELCRQRLLSDVLDRGAKTAFGIEAIRIRTAVASHFAAADIADVILASSGTDAALIATAVAMAQPIRQPTTVIVLGATETGSGVPDAASGRHYSRRSPLGDTAIPGDAIEGFGEDVTLRSLALRDARGMARATDEIESEIVEAVVRAHSIGRAILHVLDASKTGLRVPRIAFLDELKRRFGAALEIVVDASQGRLSNHRARAYLARGYKLIVTGSKFYGGPPFSGAVLIPKGQLGVRFEDSAALPSGLRAYSCATDWPCTVNVALPSENPGLILRWTAALAEMAAFARIPPQQTQRVLARFGAIVQKHLANHPFLVPFFARSNEESADWDSQATIFAFAVRDPADPRRLLDGAGLRRIQEWLGQDLSGEIADPAAASRCHIGQPVEVATGIWALRIAAGARSVQEHPAAELKDARARANVNEIDHTFAKLALILAHWPMQTALV